MEVLILLLTAAFLLLLQIVLSLSSTQSPLCPPAQRSALLQFKSHFVINESISYQSSTMQSWMEGTHCCSWKGVECDESTGNVISLSLERLHGQIPTNSSLFQLSHLQTLELFYNDFNGSPIPSELGQLVNLEYLGIYESNFSGMIPSQLSHLSKLFSLDIVEKLVSFDSHTFEMLSKNLTRLEYLNLEEVNMSAVNLKSFLNLSTSLESLHLNDCQLNGNFPVNVLRFVNLEDFSVSHNPNLTITLPKSNWSAPLEFLCLHNTSLSTKHLYPDLFGNLTMLTQLDLRSNNLEGHLPSSIFSHTLLSKLSVAFNELVSLPSNVTASPTLTYLDLSSNKFNGSIPSWLFNLSSLTDLDLSNNQFTEEIPKFLSKSFKYISLEHNKLRGPISVSMFQLPNLDCLLLSSNSLFFGNRELEGFQKLKSLRILDLSYNNLSISFLNTVDINWPKLEYLSLSYCNITQFPMFLKTQDNLHELDLSNNNIEGDIPQWMINVGKETLFYLNLSHNHLTGTFQLPWQDLEYLDLHSNMLQGLLPMPPPKLVCLFISKNNISGEVSSLYCNMSSLEILDLSHNYLSGTIPSCLGNLTTTLSVLNLQRNNFRGTIPTTYAKECALSNLNLQGNHLEGKIPSSLVNCEDLEVLDLGHNMFNDEFPEWLKTLPMLRVLVLRSNKLHGPIPNFAANDTFSKMQVLDLSSNSLVGHLPSLENLQAIGNVDKSEGAPTYLGAQFTSDFIKNYDYSIGLSVKGYEIEMQKIFHVFTSIDLSNNAFEGEIPFDIGKLVSLKGLNLSRNNLKSQIPASVGTLKNLEWLDLSSNKLSGEIPTQLVDVTSLAILNLSDNQLVGHIPEGKQFNTFTIESYKGNLGLCGYPLQRKCENEEPEPPMATTKDEITSFFSYGFGWQSMAMGYGCGIVFGVGVGYFMFRYRRPCWLLLIIENKLRLTPQRTRNSWRRNARRNYKF